MLHKTEGIVLKSVPFGETSVVCTMYTCLFGRQSYMINGVRSSKNKSKSLLQALTQLDLVVYKRGHKKLERVKEYKPVCLYQNIPFDPIKRSIGIFLSEVIYKSVLEDHVDEQLYYYLKDTLNSLDAANSITPDYPIRFMLELSKYLGFYPQLEGAKSLPFFDLQNGVFVAERPTHINYIAGNLCSLFGVFITTDEVPKSKERKAILQLLVQYFQIHIPDFHQLVSPSILETVLSDT